MRSADVDLGGVAVWVLSDGTFALDGGAMFGAVPRTRWEAALAPDATHRVRLGMNCLLVRSGDEVILVDTGMGACGGDDLVREHDVRRPGGGLRAALAAAGAARDEVTAVINTHLHWDHAGGNVTVDGSTRIPAFPRAVYFVQRGELRRAEDPPLRSRASWRSEAWRPLLAAGCLRPLDGAQEIAPGVRVDPVDGHVSHLQIVTVTGSHGTLFHPSDLVPTRHHLRPAWVMAYDAEPDRTVANKRRLLARAAAAGWWIVFGHDAETPLARLEWRDGRFAARPAAA